MKILIVTPFYMPDVGGSSRLLSDIATYLDRQGHTVDVLTYGAQPSSADAERYREYDRARHYRILRVPPQRVPGASSIAMARKVVELSIANRYDLVLCGVAYPSAILAYVNWLITRTPFAVYSHGEDVTCVSGSVRSCLARALRQARLIMTNSSFTRRRVESLGIPLGRIVCCPPWIDPTPYGEVSEEAVDRMCRRLGLTGKKVVLTLARLVERKGHDTVLRAFPAVAHAVPDAHYLVVGKGDQTRLRALAAELGMADRLTIVEEIDDDELAPVFRLADVNIMVSRWDRETRQVEGFGIVYLEAAACGRPSIAGNAGGSPDAVEHGVTGFVVDPESVEDVSDALIALLTNDRLAQSMGRAGSERVRECFSKSAMLQRIEGLLGSEVGLTSEPRILREVMEA